MTDFPIYNSLSHLLIWGDQGVKALARMIHGRRV